MRRFLNGCCSGSRGRGGVTAGISLLDKFLVATALIHFASVASPFARSFRFVFRLQIRTTHAMRVVASQCIIFSIDVSIIHHTSITTSSQLVIIQHVESSPGFSVLHVLQHAHQLVRVVHVPRDRPRHSQLLAQAVQPESVAQRVEHIRPRPGLLLLLLFLLPLLNKNILLICTVFVFLSLSSHSHVVESRHVSGRQLQRQNTYITMPTH